MNILLWHQADGTRDNKHGNNKASGKNCLPSVVPILLSDTVLRNVNPLGGLVVRSPSQKRKIQGSPLALPGPPRWAQWLRRPPRELKILGLIPAYDVLIFPGRVIPVTSKLALQWLPCQAPGVKGSVLGLVGPVSVYCDWMR